MAKHNMMNGIRVPKGGRSNINEIKLSLFKKCSEISVLYDIQIFVAITDDKSNLSVLSTKTEVSEYISNNLKIPLNATEIFTSKSVIFYFNIVQFSNNDTESSDSSDDDSTIQHNHKGTSLEKDNSSSLVNATTLSQTVTHLTDGMKKKNYNIKIPLFIGKKKTIGEEILKTSKNNLILFKEKEKNNKKIEQRYNMHNIHPKVDSNISDKSYKTSSNFTIKIPMIKNEIEMKEDIKDDVIKDTNKDQSFSIFNSNIFSNHSNYDPIFSEISSHSSIS